METIAVTIKEALLSCGRTFLFFCFIVLFSVFSVAKQSVKKKRKSETIDVEELKDAVFFTKLIVLLN